MLLANGHPDAREYPLAVLFDESSIVVERLNGMEVTRAILLQQAVSSLLSKEGSKSFKEVVEKLSPNTVQPSKVDTDELLARMNGNG